MLKTVTEPGFYWYQGPNYAARELVRVFIDTDGSLRVYQYGVPDALEVDELSGFFSPRQYVVDELAVAKQQTLRRDRSRARKAKGRAERKAAELEEMLANAQERYVELLRRTAAAEGALLEARRRSIPIGSVDATKTINFLPLYATNFEVKTRTVELRSKRGLVGDVVPVSITCTIVCDGAYLVVDEGERERKAGTP